MTEPYEYIDPDIDCVDHLQESASVNRIRFVTRHGLIKQLTPDIDHYHRWRYELHRNAGLDHHEAQCKASLDVSTHPTFCSRFQDVPV